MATRKCKHCNDKSCQECRDYAAREAQRVRLWKEQKREQALMGKTTQIRPPGEPQRQQLAIVQLRIDGDTQSRPLDMDAISDNLHTLQSAQPEKGTEIVHPFPPVWAIKDTAGDFWLFDGFHRRATYKEGNLPAINVEWWEGTLEDAQWYSSLANLTHGVRRTQAAKEWQVRKALSLPRGTKQSRNEIARERGVSWNLVDRIAREMESAQPDTSGTRSIDGQTRTYTNPKTGKESTMKTGNIGKSSSTETALERTARLTREVREKREAEEKTLAEKAAGAEVVHDTITPAESDAGSDTEPIAEADLTEDEWLQTIPAYRVLAGMQGKGLIARRSMLDVRYLHKALLTFQHHAARAETVKHPDNTMVSTALNGIAQLGHPRSWQLCAPCKGGGCKRCGNAGYDITGAGIDPARVESGEVKL